jgi:hypothetical protein
MLTRSVLTRRFQTRPTVTRFTEKLSPRGLDPNKPGAGGQKLRETGQEARAGRAMGDGTGQGGAGNGSREGTGSGGAGGRDTL